MDLVPIKVKIGLRANGHADHPDWHKLPLAKTEEPAHHMKHGWKYDKTCGHAEHNAESPHGMQWGMVLVSQLFATQAVATFPGIVTIMTEAEAVAFWDDKAHGHMEEDRTDTTHLQGLKAERDLLVDLRRNTAGIDIRISKALDPNDPAQGKRKDKQVKWSTAKGHLGIKLAASVQP
jgi:hypothetical protein